MPKTDINVNDIASKLTLKINITGVKKFGLRVLIAKVFLKIGGFIMPCKVSISGFNKPKFIKYKHHGEEVWVKESLKGTHREHCLCFSCSEFMVSGNKCEIADKVYKNCIDYNLVTPVFECKAFVEDK